MGRLLRVLVVCLLAAPSCGGDGNGPRRPLGKRGTENLIAFGRLLGYVRHFHPSDEAAANDWDSFAIMGVEAVEDAPTATELQSRLEQLFRPLAPTLRLSTKPLPPVNVAALGRSDIAPPRITGWLHRGWPDLHGFYEEWRIVAPAAAPGDSVLPIGSEVNTALGGGVWCSVPLTLYVNTHGTVPHGVGTVPKLLRPEGWEPSGSDRATRLADVLLFWNVMQHFFPYFDVTGTDWLAQLPPALREAATSDSPTFEVTLRRLASKLRDGHVFVSSPYSRPPPTWPVAWSFVGSRLVLVGVDTTLVGNAHVGDEVLALNGRPTSEWVKEAEEVQSGATPQGTRDRVARALMSMVATDKLTLDLRSPTGALRRVEETPQERVSLAPARPGSVQEVRPGVMYLDISRITEADLEAALPKINEGKGVIFDLRGYPYHLRGAASVIAHLTDSTVASPRWGFPIILRPDHRDTTCAWEDWSVKPASPRIRAHAAFLINAVAISASETMLGFVEHYRLADLIGEPTAGTNGVVTSVRLPGGYSVSFTGMKVLKQDGSRHHGVGILPTVPVSPTIAGIAAGRDEQLERAIDVVSH